MISLPASPRLAAFATGIVALALLPATAPAGTALDSLGQVPSTSCVPGGSSPFLPWGDPGNYSLLPGGDFERGAVGWTLSRGARIVSGNEPWRVSNALDRSSLALPDGSSAATPAICAGLADPTIRFFVSAVDDDNAGRLDVSVLVKIAGSVRELPVATISGRGGWRPTPVIPFLANATALASGGAAQVSFRFVSRGGGWRIDDVYVDPLKSH